MGGSSSGGATAQAGSSSSLAGATQLPECAGSVPISAHSKQCRVDGDCPNGEQCVDPAETICSGPLPPPECQADKDCGTGLVCMKSSDPCAGFQCVTPCTSATCETGETCGSDGHCDPESCAMGYTCPTGYSCSSGAGTDSHGCKLPRCEQSGGCQPNYRCDPTSTSGDGCVVKTCSTNSDCDCGACIGGQCAPNPYICTTITGGGL
jgi:hypothetical protein